MDNCAAFCYDKTRKISVGCNVMTYDFTTIMDRSGKDALAVDAIGAYVS